MKKISLALLMIVVWITIIPGFIFYFLAACVASLYCKVIYKFTKEECLDLFRVVFDQVKDTMRLTKEIIND